MAPLLLLKRAVCRLGLGSMLLEFCEECGRGQRFSWWAAPELWHDVVGKGDGGVLCPSCFADKAYRLGLILLWVPRVQCIRDSGGQWSEVAPPDPELFPVAAKGVGLHA